METPFTIAEVIKDSDKIGIAGHVRPDGDCVGSTLGLFNFIKNNYPEKNVRIFLEPIPNKFKFLQNSDLIEEVDAMEEFDVFFALDCGAGDRLGKAFALFEKAKRTVCIDHHVSNASFAEYNYIVPDASSTCELIYNLICSNPIPKEIAECLYTGMVTDTGVFQYSCTSKSTMYAAGELMDTGIDYPRICDKVFFEKTYNQSRVMAYAVLKSKTYHEGQIISSFITRKEMAEYEVSYKELDGISADLRNVLGVKVSVFLYENEDGTYKASTRASSDDIDLSQIAMHFHGGGHKKAAGFTLNGNDPDQLIQMILAEIEKQL